MMMKGDRPPFDNAHMRTIFYSRENPRDQDEAVENLRAAAAALTDPVQNLVTHALGTLDLSQGDAEQRVIATVSAQVDRHDADIRLLQDLLKQLVHALATPIPTPRKTAVDFLSGGVVSPAFGGLSGLGSGLLSPPNALADMFDPTNTEQKKK